MTYDQVNKFIEGMNKAYRAKYKLLKQRKSALNDANRKRYEAYKSQETKETKGKIYYAPLQRSGGILLCTCQSVSRSIDKPCPINN